MSEPVVTDDVQDDDGFLCLPPPKPKRPRSMRWKAYAVTWMIKVMARMLKFFGRWDVKVYNKKSIPKDGPVLCVGNHLSFGDPPLWGATISRNGAIVAAAELGQMKFIGFFLRMLFHIRGDILVDRQSDESRQEVVDKTDAILGHGGLVGVYPEGGIKRDRWNKGMFTLAKKHEAAIVIIRVDGVDDFWASTKADLKAPGRNGKVFNFKAKLRISYSDPIYFDDYKHMTDVELAKYCHDLCNSMVIC